MTEKIETKKAEKIDNLADKPQTERAVEWLTVESLDIEAQGVAHKAILRRHFPSVATTVVDGLGTHFVAQK